MRLLLRIAAVVAASAIVILGTFAFVQQGGVSLLGQGGAGEFARGGDPGRNGQRATGTEGHGTGVHTEPGGGLGGDPGREQANAASGSANELASATGRMMLIAAVVIGLNILWRTASRRLRPPRRRPVGGSAIDRPSAGEA